jgi:hypothetical protein
MKSVLVLAALSAFSAPTLAPMQVGALDIYSSNEGGYSVNFPAPPEETRRDIGPNRIIAHAERNGDVVYVAAHGDFTVALKPDIEMNANIDNYAHEVHAAVTARKPVSLRRGERTLAGIEFSYDGSKQAGKGIVVVDGTSSYLVAAGSVKPARHSAEVDAFVASFRLAPKN